MQYNKTTNWESICDQYDHVIAWGTGSLLQMNYKKEYYPLDLIVDGASNHIGMKFGDLTVCEPEKIKELTGKLLIVIYAIYEQAILLRLKEMGVEADTIIYDLLKIHTVHGREFPLWHGKHADDMVLIELADRLGIKNLQYMDIGVCHPVMRNNTYSLYELGYTGVLVEPNPMFHGLVEHYRKDDILLRCGAGVSAGELTYYAFPDKPGYGTFNSNLGEYRKSIGLKCEVSQIPIMGINEIIEKNFEQYPNVIDIDAEGIDFELLHALDTQHYPVEIIMCETLGVEARFNQMMVEKGYRRYANIGENTVYLRANINPTGLFAF
ncbi:MAG: FkbM family methyltransferase [Clostridia bacterium]|nr:FkbM family methyltransferase [Clostridia bacterium]